MKIFLKYIFKCMTEKKSRFILLIISIALSTGLFITIFGTVNVAIRAYEKPMKESHERKEIIINSTSQESFFNIDDINNYGVKNIEGQIIIYGTTDDEDVFSVSVRGKKRENIENITLLKGSINDFKDNSCIISERISNKYNINVGDKLKVYVAGESKEYKVIAVSYNEGIFYNDSSVSYSIIVPYETLAKNYEVEGKYNYVIANKDTDDLDESINKFNDNNINYKAKQLYNEKVVYEQVSSITNILYFMLIIVVIMSAIIIYSSFKLAITERLPVIGTFMSQGATNWKIEKILLMESQLYGIIGSIFGCFIGYLGLYLINYMISPMKEYGIIEKFHMNYMYIIVGIIFSIILSMLSALVPIRKIRKLEIKDIILNSISVPKKSEWSKFIVGAILLIFSIVMTSINSKIIDMCSVYLLIISIIAVMLIYPKIIEFIMELIYKLLRGRSKMLIFSFNNLRTSKILKGNITLVTISIIAIFMISSVGNSLVTLVTGAYEGVNFDVSVTGFSGVEGVEGKCVTEDIIQKIEENSNVKKDTIQKMINTSAIIENNSMVFVNAVESDKYKDYIEYLELNSSKNKDLYEKFRKSINDEIIVSDKIMQDYNLKEGDSLKVNINDIEKTLKVIGSINCKLYDNNSLIIMKYETAQKLFNINEATEIYLKSTISQEEIKEELKEELKMFGVNIITRDTFLESNIEQNQMMIKILNIFSYFAIFIAVLGVFNNIIVSFLQRKRELAILSSIGMSRGIQQGMLLIESVIVAIFSILIASLYTCLGVSIMTRVMSGIGLPMDIKFNFNVIVPYTIVTILLMVIGSVSVLFKSKKISIVDELKYE